MTARTCRPARWLAAIAVTTCAAAALWSCSFFHTPLPGSSCDEDRDCLGGESCSANACVPSPDAAPTFDARPPPDANRDPDGAPVDADLPDAMETADADLPDAS